MRQGLRVIVAMLALVLGLHVFMLAGLGSHDAGMPADHGAMRIATSGATGLLAEPAGLGHDMATACLAVLAGMLLLGARMGRTARRSIPERRRLPAAPADPPPSPPPIALGISRT
jgi:hypothetical protein